MKLTLHRNEFFEDRTIGGFYIDDTWAYFCLEDTDRKLEDGGIKIPKQTAIPRGRHKVTISWSNRFKRDMPLLLDVIGFDGVRIHAGNVPTDTEGCLLIGMGYDILTHNILKSKIAFDDFFTKLTEALETGEVWIKVT